ncbi:amidohydrolase family protein [Catenuloplanes japonicus]|uniref:amidohydrolase family protein n=1 Tax=Catenuloplanes japonicus TaxID=33876 RepID=UPI000525C97A|nr:amidohydrolase family protein [Catenuloplanes japonicus]
MFTITGVRVFDGSASTDAPVLTDVHVSGGRIVATPPPGAEVVEGRGRTLLPGLIDTHVHVERRAELAELARWGVTTALDMGSPRPAATLPLRHLDGVADLFSAVYPAVAPGSATIRQMGYPAHIAVPGAADAQAWVDARIAEGADYIKIAVEDPRQPGTTGLSPATVTALVEAAHARGLLTVAHAVTAATHRIASVADVVTHVPIQAVASGARVVSPTLTMMRGICDTVGRRFALRALAALRIAPRMDFAHALGSVRRLHAEGATVLAGTDSNSDGTAPFSPAFGTSMHQELRLLVDAGLSPVEALRAATSVPAKVFGLDDRGVVAPGKRADLLLVDGDPTTDIHSTVRIAHVWTAGVTAFRSM